MMPRYRIHRMKDAPRENFRWAPHTGGEATVKLKDYEVAATDSGEMIDAPTPYAAWKLSAETQPLRPGDLLEVAHELAEGEPAPEPELYLTKYIGFDRAKWFIPEPKRTEALPDASASISAEPGPTPLPSASGAR